MTERVDHGSAKAILKELIGGEVRYIESCICGEVMPSARTPTGAAFKVFSHALAATRSQYVDALRLLNERDGEPAGVTEVSQSPMVTIAMHPALTASFNEWLDGRQLEMSPPIKINDDDQFHVIQPKQHVWSSLADNPRDVF